MSCLRCGAQPCWMTARHPRAGQPAGVTLMAGQRCRHQMWPPCLSQAAVGARCSATARLRASSGAQRAQSSALTAALHRASPERPCLLTPRAHSLEAGTSHPLPSPLHTPHLHPRRPCQPPSLRSVSRHPCSAPRTPRHTLTQRPSHTSSTAACCPHPPHLQTPPPRRPCRPPTKRFALLAPPPSLWPSRMCAPRATWSTLLTTKSGECSALGPPLC